MQDAGRIEGMYTYSTDCYTKWFIRDKIILKLCGYYQNLIPRTAPGILVPINERYQQIESTTEQASQVYLQTKFEIMFLELLNIENARTAIVPNCYTSLSFSDVAHP
jgi:hypothetical protein